MSDLLEYKGYKGTVEFDSDDDILHGRVLFINSLLIYHGEGVSELKHAFQKSIDDYLVYCERVGVEPNKPFNGSFNIGGLNFQVQHHGQCLAESA
jgi:predicted HicB family RNase H-like nuclease